MIYRFRLWFCIVPVFTLLAPKAFPQVASSSLSGAITDPQGSPVPRARIEATELATGLRRQTQTTSRGRYVLTDLPAGTFSVDVLKNGFATVHVERVEQTVGQTSTLNLRLSIANAAQRINVAEPLVQLDRVDAQPSARRSNRNKWKTCPSTAAIGQP